MITRITIHQTSVLSADLAAPRVMPTPASIEYAAKRAAILYEAFYKMLSFHRQYPDQHNPEQLFNVFLGSDWKCVKKERTKKQRTYTAGGITITEEDK